MSEKQKNSETFKFATTVAPDKKAMAIQMPGMSEPLVMDAIQLSQVIEHLGAVRVAMEPAIPAVDLQPGTRVSPDPAVRWQVAESPQSGLFQLFLLHPGFGWLSISLGEEALEKIAKFGRMFLRGMPSIH
ncbi:hypothetical protein [Acetobacter indonesiensis]|uniref:hypothetical protein n=1 Tax=Acetobacter indonesiensis TaxID=104101 RepID=UPI0039EBC31A